MNLPRSTFNYRAVFSDVIPTDAEIIALFEDIQTEFPRYGYRRVTHELRRRGRIVNHKKVARIMRLAGLSIKPRRRYLRTTDSRHDQPIQPNLYRNKIPDRPDRVWVADFTYTISVSPRASLSGDHPQRLQPQGRRLCALTAPGHPARTGRLSIGRRKQEAPTGMRSSAHG